MQKAIGVQGRSNGFLLSCFKSRSLSRCFAPTANNIPSAWIKKLAEWAGIVPAPARLCMTCHLEITMNLRRLLLVITFTFAVLVCIFNVLSPYVAQAGGVVGPPCDEPAFTAALSGGGAVTFNCGASNTILIVHLKS